MRIAYVARYDISRESGILKKIEGQIRAWIALGRDVRLFALSPGRDVWAGVRDLPIVPFHNDDLRTRLLWRSHVSRPILEWKPDVVYYRYSTYYPAMDRVQKSVATVLEINSDDLAEYPLILPRPLYWAHRMTRSRVHRRAAGLVFVTSELARHSSNTRFDKPSLVLGNGIDLARHESIPAPGGDCPRLIFVGTAGCPWHGMDHVIEMARLLPEASFDVVGYGLSDVSNNAPENVELHGYLERSDYESLLFRADVAIGSLALYRNSMEEACPLKTREYLARGIPTIIAYQDTDFPDGHPLLLRLANTPTNVEDGIGAIREFVTKAVGQRVPRSDVAHLDVHVKERIRLEFMERVASQSVTSL